MIYHFPNFVCWYDIFKDYVPTRDRMYIDGASCQILGRLLGVRGTYYSGPEMAYDLFGKEPDSQYFLLPNDVKSIPDRQKMVLPFKEHFEGDKDLLKFLSQIPANSKVIIGVSAPKQNSLARYLYDLRDDLEYYCLGAAVVQTWGSRYGNTILRGTGFQWIEFLAMQPRRTLKKQKETILSLLGVLLNAQLRAQYKLFVLSTRQ